MLEKIKNGADGAIDVGIKLISLSIILQVIFGAKVAFLTGDVISSILNIVWTLGNAGLAGIIAAGIIWKLLDKSDDAALRVSSAELLADIGEKETAKRLAKSATAALDERVKMMKALPELEAKVHDWERKLQEENDKMGGSTMLAMGLIIGLLMAIAAFGILKYLGSEENEFLSEEVKDSVDN